MITSITWLQSALNFFINVISIPQQSFPNISTVPPFQSVLSIFVFSLRPAFSSPHKYTGVQVFLVFFHIPFLLQSTSAWSTAATAT
jgi:hypothetical protein